MRVNIGVSDKINAWFENKSKELGVSKSAMMCMALSEYIDQKQGLEGIADLQVLYQKAIEIENKSSEK